MAKNRKKKSFDPIKANKAAARKAHFESGGTTATWRGRAVTFIDLKTKKRNKRWKWNREGSDE